MVFFVGSLIAALSNSIKMLIAARAIQGIGGGGLLILANICISDLFSMRYGACSSTRLQVGTDLEKQGSWEIFWNDRWCLGGSQRRGSSSRRGLYAKGIMALVLLY
jgi:hypothetical protein